MPTAMERLSGAERTQTARASLNLSLGHEAMPATYRHVAEPTLDELQAKLDPEELASARQATAGLELDELVSKMLARERPAPVPSSEALHPLDE